MSIDFHVNRDLMPLQTQDVPQIENADAQVEYICRAYSVFGTGPQGLKEFPGLSQANALTQEGRVVIARSDLEVRKHLIQEVHARWERAHSALHRAERAHHYYNVYKRWKNVVTIVSGTLVGVSGVSSVFASAISSSGLDSTARKAIGFCEIAVPAVVGATVAWLSARQTTSLNVMNSIAHDPFLSRYVDLKIDGKAMTNVAVPNQIQPILNQLPGPMIRAVARTILGNENVDDRINEEALKKNIADMSDQYRVMAAAVGQVMQAPLSLLVNTLDLAALRRIIERIPDGLRGADEDEIRRWLGRSPTIRRAVIDQLKSLPLQGFLPMLNVEALRLIINVIPERNRPQRDIVNAGDINALQQAFLGLPDNIQKDAIRGVAPDALVNVLGLPTLRTIIQQIPERPNGFANMAVAELQQAVLAFPIWFQTALIGSGLHG